MSSVESLLWTAAPHLQQGYVRGTNYVLIRCPFHGGGTEKTPSCSVSTTKPVFFCHSCLTSGHLTRLLRNLGFSKNAARQAVEDAGLNQPHQKAADALAVKYQGNPYRGDFILDDDLLDDYRQAPKMLLKAGFTKSTLRHFEVGFDDQNLRITFPLRNIYGELVGVSGRAVVDEMDPRYKIYRRELIEGRPEFHVPANYNMDSVKQALLWHGHVVHPFLYEMDDEALIITEGFKACMWVWQSGYQTPVALVGAYLSDLQAELIGNATRYVFLFLDNNKAGLKGTFFAAEKLLRKGIKFKIARYPDDREQPDQLDPKEVQEALRNANSFAEWKAEHDRLVSEVAWTRLVRASLRD